MKHVIGFYEYDTSESIDRRLYVFIIDRCGIPVIAIKLSVAETLLIDANGSCLREVYIRVLNGVHL